MPIGDGQVMGRIRSFLTEPTFANVSGMTPEDVDRRRALAQALWSEGNSSRPVVGVLDGMNRVLQSYLGGKGMWRAEHTDIAVREREDQQQQAGLGLMADFAYPQAGTGTGSTTPLPAAPTFNQTYNAGSQNEWAPGDFPGGDTVPNAASRIAAYGVGDGFSVEGVDQTFATGFDRAAADYIAQGGNPADVRLYDVTRSAETQAQLHANYTQQPVVWNGVTYQPNVGPGVQGLAAPPGQSRHQTGAAADIGEGPFLDWMHQNAGQYGLAFLTGNAFTNDPGHVQLAANASEGTAADGGVGQFVRELIANPQTRGVAAQLIGDQITRLTTPPAPVEPIEINGQLVDPNTRQVVGDYRDAPAPADREVRNDQNGVPRYVDTGDPVFPGVDAAPTPINFGDEEALRDNFRMETSDYRLVQGHFQRLQAAAANPSAAGDIAMIFAYMKMLDPGSVVRETEYATAQNAAGVPTIVQNIWNRLKDGQRLAPEQRADFLGQAQALFTATEQQYAATEDRFRSIAEQYGMDPNRLFGEDVPTPAMRRGPAPMPAGAFDQRFPSSAAPDGARELLPGILYVPPAGR